MPSWINAFRKVFGGGDDNVSAAQAVKDVLNGKGEVYHDNATHLKMEYRYENYYYRCENRWI